MKCDELKAFDIVVAEEGNGEGIVKYRRAVYDKAEVDKMISELKADYKEACDRLQTANLIKEEQMAKVAKQSEVISSLKREIGNLERRVYAANRDARRTRY